MSAQLPEPLFHFPLSETRYSKSVDAYVTPNLGTETGNGTVSGQPRMVLDPHFGGCMQFDGGSGSYLEWSPPAPETPESKFDQGLTIGGFVLPSRGTVPLVQLEIGSSVLSLSADPDGEPEAHVRFDTHSAVSQTYPKDQWLGKWHHVAATVAGTSSGKVRMTLFVDGVAQKQARPEFTPNSLGPLTKLLIAKNNTSFRGTLAHVRVYDRPLTAQEIANVMKKDQTQLAAFRGSQPLTLDLYTIDATDHVQVLFIEPLGHGKPLVLSMTNATGGPVTFDSGVTTPTQTDYHVQLRFRKSVIAPALLTKLRAGGVTIPDWKYAVSPAASGGREDWISFVRHASAPPPSPALPAAGSVTLQIPGLSAAALYGSRNTRVEVAYKNIKSGSSSYHGSVLRFMAIQSKVGQKDVPLGARVVGPNTLLNDDTTDNTLAIEIFNTSSPPLKLAGNSPASQFILYVDNMLTTATAPASTAPHLSLERGKAEPGPESWAYHYTVTDQEPSYKIALNNWIVPEPPTSPTSKNPTSGEYVLTLKYQNVPGYQDGEWTIPIQLGPLVVKGEKVGIGIVPTSTSAKLDVKGDVSAGQPGAKLTIQALAQAGGPINYNKISSTGGDIEIDNDLNVADNNITAKTITVNDTLTAKGEIDATGQAISAETINATGQITAQGGLDATGQTISAKTIKATDRITAPGIDTGTGGTISTYGINVTGQITVTGDASLQDLNVDGAIHAGDTVGYPVPVGAIIIWTDPFKTQTIPDGWAVCDGTAYSYKDSGGNDQTLVTPEIYRIDKHKKNKKTHKNIDVGMFVKSFKTIEPGGRRDFAGMGYKHGKPGPLTDVDFYTVQLLMKLPPGAKKKHP